MENTDNNFVRGLFCKMPNKAAPDFVLLDVSFKLKEFVEWAKANMDERGWVNTQILRSKDGSKLYGKLNDWKPTPTAETTKETQDYNDNKYKTIDDVKTTATGRTSPTEEHPEGLSLEDIPF